MLRSGEDYSDLPETFVIFITENDVIGEGLPLYTIERKITNTGKSFDDKSFDVILLDIDMPETDGLAVAELIRNLTEKEIQENKKTAEFYVEEFAVKL